MIFDKTDIKRFLLDRPGYLKEGKERLFEILSKREYIVTLEDVDLALSEARKENKASDKIVKEIMIEEVPENFEKVSAWQGANGEWLASYKKKKEESGESWSIFQNTLIEALEGLEKPKIKPAKNNGNIAMEISLPDLHFGKGDMKNLKAEFLQTVANLVAKVPNERIERFILPIGNDGLNSEGLRLTTTAGTPQHDSAPWYETFTTYSAALVEAINYLNTIAPVDVVVIQGNHDWERMFYVGEVISAYYGKSKTVSVNNLPDPRKYYKYGKCLIMYTHGDKEKPADMPLIMATEQPLLFADSSHREVHCGHLHKEMLNEFRGIKVRFLPSICGTDDWHKNMGYSHYRCGQAFLWDSEKGLDGFVQENL
jgi:hypothetical protein